VITGGVRLKLKTFCWYGLGNEDLAGVPGTSHWQKTGLSRYCLPLIEGFFVEKNQVVSKSVCRKW